MKKVRRYAYLYIRFISQDLKRLLEYQLDFVIQFVASFLMQIVGLITIWGIFKNVQEINGWSYWEIVLVYSTMHFSVGFGEIFFEGPWSINGLVLQGKLDYMVTRPLPVVFQIFAFRIGLNGIGNIVTATVVMITAFLHLSDEITIGNVILCILLFMVALPIKGAIILAANCITFWTKAPGNAFGNLVHNIGEYSKYPLSVYPQLIRFIVTFLVPYAFVSYLPVSFLLEKGTEARLMCFVPVVSVLSIFLSVKLFKRGLKLYESVGN